MKTSGFTLLETVIYIALFAILMSGALVTLYALMGSVATNQMFESAYAEGLFIQQKLAWELSQATAITLVDPQTLRIVNNTDVVLFTASSSQWWLTKDTGIRLPLSSFEYAVSDVVIIVSSSTREVSAHIMVKYRIGGLPFSYVTYLVK